jgi:adenine-specific DNA-methyltransferase
MKVFISGSIGTETLNEQAVHCLDAIMNNQDSVLIGDAFGADKAVQQYLFQHDCRPVTVYCSGDKVRNNIGSWQTKQISNDLHLKGKSRYQLKDAAMARDAD